MAINKALLAALKALSYTEPDVKKNVDSMRQRFNVMHPKVMVPTVYRKWDHVVRCQNHEVPVRLFTPLDTINRPVLLFFHGGGWVTGNIDSYDRLCANLTKLTNHVVISVDYRLAPEFRFPAGLDDCYAVAKEVFADTRILFGVDCQQVTLIGDSAGGNLAAAISLMARDRGDFSPRAQILLYPAVNNDHNPATTPFNSVRANGSDYLLTAKRICDYMDLYESAPEDRQNPYFAPLLASDFTRQPRTLIITAEYDPLRDEGEEYAKRLKEAGNEVFCYRVPDSLHGFFALPVSYEPVRQAFLLINHFLNNNPVPADWDKPAAESYGGRECAAEQESK